MYGIYEEIICMQFMQEWIMYAIYEEIIMYAIYEERICMQFMMERIMKTVYEGKNVCNLWGKKSLCIRWQ